MSSQPIRQAAAEAAHAMDEVSARQSPDGLEAQREPGADEMPCPICGSVMPDLKGGKATICPTCGFKDSCCF